MLIDFGSHMVDLLLSLFDRQPMMDLLGQFHRENETNCAKIDLRVLHQGEPIENSRLSARWNTLGRFDPVRYKRAVLDGQ